MNNYRYTFVALACAAAFSTVAVSMAQEIEKTIIPDSYALVGPHNELLTPWIPIQKTEGNPRPTNYNWQIAYDSASYNLATSTPFTNVYGPAAGSRREAFPGTAGLKFDTTTTGPAGTTKFYDAPWSINDAVFNPPARGKAVTRWYWNERWNPAGTYPTAGGTATMISILRFWQGPSVSQRFSTGGIAFQSTNLAAGSYNSSFTPTATAAYASAVMSVPYEEGWVEMLWGTLDGSGAIVKLPAPGIVSGRYYPMNSPTWPYTPGTNPSDSAPGFYVDDSINGSPYSVSTLNPALNLSDWIMTYAEDQVPGTGAESYDTGTLKLEPAAMFAVDQDTLYIHGNVNFADQDPSSPRPIIAAEVKIGESGNHTVNAVTRNVFINKSTGEFWAAVPLDVTRFNWVNDTYDVSFSTCYSYDGSYTHWLRKTVTGVVVSGASANIGTIDITNGDVDGDNEVTLADYGQLAGAFGTAVGDAGYVKAADLNHDDEVNLADYSILARNFGLAGDDPF